MLTVKEVTRDGFAVVCTEGLFRMVLIDSEEIVDEFVTAAEAEMAIEFWEECGGGLTVKAVSYSSIQRS